MRKNLILAAASIALVIFTVPVSFAAITFTGTGIAVDSSTSIDASGTITVGGSSATGIVIGNSGIQASFPGSVSVAGNATTTKLSVTSLAGASGCLSVSTSGAITTSTCGTFTASGDLSGSANSQAVVGLYGNPLSSSTPSASQVLTWNGSLWTPANAATGTGVTSINGLSSSTFVFSGTGASQITVATSGANVVTWSLPQGIGTSSVPAFGGIAISGNATATSLSITGLASSGSPCLVVGTSGAVSTSTCGVGGGTGTVTTSSAVTANDFPLWATVAGGLSGTSTLTLSGTALTQSGGLTVTGNATHTSASFSGAANFSSTVTQSGGLVSLSSTTISGNATTTSLSITGLAGATGCLSVSASGAVATSSCSSGAGTPGGSTGNLQYNTGGNFAGLADTAIDSHGGLDISASGANANPFAISYTGSSTAELLSGGLIATASLGQEQAITPTITLDADDGSNTATFATYYSFNTLNLAGNSSVTHDIGSAQRIVDNSTSTSVAQSGGAVDTSGAYYGDYTKTPGSISTTTKAIIFWDAGENIMGGGVSQAMGEFVPVPQVNDSGTLALGYGDFIQGPQAASSSSLTAGAMSYYSSLETGASGFGENCGNFGGYFGSGNLYLDQCNFGNTSGFNDPVVIGFEPDVTSTLPMTNTSPNMLAIHAYDIIDMTSTLLATGANIDLQTGSASAGTIGGLKGVDATVDHEAPNATATQLDAFNATLKNGGGGNVTNAYLYKGQYSGANYGVITNLYGLYLSGLKPTTGPGSVTNLYDVYAADASATNYFAGPMGLGTSSPATDLQVTDANGSSTVRIGRANQGSCLEMTAASGTVGTLVYVYYDSNAVQYATTTKPSFCE